MGFDLYGQDPKSKSGEYFRNNIWFWHRLWEFVCHVAGDILTEEEQRCGHFNEGLEIDRERAVIIARRLKEVLLQKDLYEKEVAETDKAFDRNNQQLAQVVQKICTQLGAEFEPRECAQRFSWENVHEFAEFCANSGGFQVC